MSTNKWPLGRWVPWTIVATIAILTVATSLAMIFVWLVFVPIAWWGWCWGYGEGRKVERYQDDGRY